VIGFPAAPRQIDRSASLAALILVATVTEAMFLLLPSFVGALGDVLHLLATCTGLLASADLTGIALTTATAPRWTSVIGQSTAPDRRSHCYNRLLRQNPGNAVETATGPCWATD
jgi:hypothetical protein